MTVEAAGFKKFASRRFPLTVQEQATVDARVEVGELNETVDVSATAAHVNTTIANLGQVIDNKTIVSLPNLEQESHGVHLFDARGRRIWRPAR